MTLEAILKQTTDLPTFPAAALAVLKETSSADASANSISKHITQDQALTARVLRLANSAYYGLPRQVMDVSESVIVLGTRTVRNLCMVAATYPWMSRPLPGYGLEPYHLWVNSFSVALGSKLIAERTGAAQSDSAFTAGLLHNIGKVALSAWLENKLGSVQQIAQAEGLSFDEVERRMFGFDHAEVGAFLAERWNLPKPYVDVIRFHHQPEACGAGSPLVDITHLADHLSMNLGFGVGGDGLLYRFSEPAMSELGLTAGGLEELGAELSETYEKQEKLFLDNESASERRAA